MRKALLNLKKKIFKTFNFKIKGIQKWSDVLLSAEVQYVENSECHEIYEVIGKAAGKIRKITQNQMVKKIISNLKG